MPFLIAFGVLGVLMAVLIIGNVIAGAVSTGTRRIGILKALGFTPSQVVRAYLGPGADPRRGRRRARRGRRQRS